MEIFVQQQQWKGMKRYVFCAVIHNRLVATAQLELFPDGTPTNFNGTAYFYALWVNEPFRRSGVAEQLLCKAEETARAEGHENLHLLWALKDSPRWVAEWYANGGYEHIEVNSRCTEILFRKKLTA